MPPRKSVRRSLRKQKDSKRRNTRKTNRKTMRRQSRMRKTNRKTMRRKNKYRKSLRGGVGTRPLPPPPIEVKEDIIREGLKKNPFYTTYDYLTELGINDDNEELFKLIRSKIELNVEKKNQLKNLRDKFASSNFSLLRMTPPKQFLTENDAKKLFDLIDKDGDKEITDSELQAIYAQSTLAGAQIRRNDYDNKNMGGDEDGKISIDEFIGRRKNNFVYSKDYIIFSKNNISSLLKKLSRPDTPMPGTPMSEESSDEDEDSSDEDEDSSDEDDPTDVGPPRSGTPDPRPDEKAAVQRGHEERREQQAKTAAATKIQAVWRGRSSRRRQLALSAAERVAADEKEEKEKLLKLILKQHALIEETFNLVKL